MLFSFLPSDHYGGGGLVQISCHAVGEINPTAVENEKMLKVEHQIHMETKTLGQGPGFSQIFKGT